MRALVNTLLIAVSLLALALGWRFLHADAPKPPPPPPSAPVEERCDEVRTTIPALQPELSGASLTLVDPSAPLTIDGKAPGAVLVSGVHTIESSGVRVPVRVEPFSAVLIDVRSVEEVPTLLIVGATCATCSHSDTELDLSPSRGVIGSALSLAGAVAKNDWVLAVQQLRGLPPSEHATPTIARLIAIVEWLAGHPSRSREWLARLPKKDPLHAALEKRDRDELQVTKRQLTTAAARWNGLSERYQRLTDAFVRDAPELTTELTTRFDEFSRRLSKSVTAKDGVAAELVLQDAAEALNASIVKLRELKSDCVWQRRVWAAL